MTLRKCTPVHTDTVAAWLRSHQPYLVDYMLLYHPKDYAAKLIRDTLHSRGITHAEGIPLSRTQIRQALTQFRRHNAAERAALIAAKGREDE